MNKSNKKGGPSTIDVHVGQRLRVRRSLLGLSQEKLASLIGLTFQQIQKYERGTNRISAGRLYEFSKLLEVPVQYFFEQMDINVANKQGTASYQGLSDNKQEGFEGNDNDDIMTRKETLDLIRTYYTIKDPETRKDIIKFIKSMAERFS
ncbi:MAG: helix-turn-helix transcriptional regulator [Alphaproteobacteria bacterium]|nr:helix-turn-helix transcriptional regulator [Alphaproteobacteria bacterium]